MTTWNDLLTHIAATPTARFRECQEEFLIVAQTYNDLWVKGELDQGMYRQKGSQWQRVITSIVEARTEVTLDPRELEGLTGIHRPDIVYQQPDGTPLVVGEAKMLGTRGHWTPEGVWRPDRGCSVDIEKRLKEVKYTPVDLKLRYGGTRVGDWRKWIKDSLPRFYSFWAFLVVGRDRPAQMLERLRSLRDYYNNGVGAFFFKMVDDRYVPLQGTEFDEFDVDRVIDEIVALIGS
jgi:hypothetical protein